MLKLKPRRLSGQHDVSICVGSSSSWQVWFNYFFIIKKNYINIFKIINIILII